MKTHYLVKAVSDTYPDIQGYVSLKNPPQIDIYKYRDWGHKFYSESKAKTILSACKNLQYANPLFFSRQFTFSFSIEKVSKEL